MGALQIFYLESWSNYRGLSDDLHWKCGNVKTNNKQKFAIIYVFGNIFCNVFKPRKSVHILF